MYRRTSREVRASLFDRAWDFQDSHLDWKTWENGKALSSQGKSNKILEKSRNFRQMLFIIFSDI